MKVLFVSAGNNYNKILPFIKSQEDSLRNAGVDIDHFSLTQNNLSGVSGYFRATRIIRKMVREKGYQIIHAHYSFCGWAAVLAFTGVPVIVSLMGTDVYGLVDQNGRRKLKSYGVIACAKLLQYFVDKIIVKSNNLRKSISLKRKVVVVPNGVDFNRFKPRDKALARKELGLSVERKLILFMGNPGDPRKNYQLLENAMTNLADLNVELVLPFPTVAKNVPIYYNVADVFVLTSYLEGSPNVVKEAMASGCPVVATDVGDVSDVISKTDGCFLSEFDPMDLAQKIRNALNFKNHFTGRNDISHLHLDQIASKIIAVYTSLFK